MRAFIFISLLASLAVAIWPQPVTYKHGDSVLFIDDDFSVNLYEPSTGNVGSIVDEVPFAFSSNSNTNAGSQYASDNLTLRTRYTNLKAKQNEDISNHTANEGVSDDEIIDHAIHSTWRTLFKHNLDPWKFHSRDWEEPVRHHDASRISCIDIRLLVAGSLNIAKPLAGEIDESYSLILEEGKVRLDANTSIGVARGFTTLTQLFYVQSNGKDVYTPFAPFEIHDAPKFQHRGINLDVARNYFPVKDIMRQINAAAYNKMNRFHLHVTDGQSWPLEIPSIAELSAKGAYRPDLVYTAKDFRHIQRHAAIQGVELITEIDMPGHTSSIHHSFPDLIAAFNKQPNWDTYAAEPPSGTLKLNSTAVSDFLEKLFDDLLPRVYPYSSYFHTGGDEVNKNAYALDDTVQSSDFAVLQPLMQKFVDRNHGQVRAQGLIPMVWEEMLLEWNLTLGNDVIIQSWQSDEAVAQIVEKGHKVLVGNYNYWYLDCGKGQWLSFDPSISSPPWPYIDYCAPFHNWRLIYSYDPLSGVPAEHQHLVLGGEAHMWAEQTDPVNIDRMIWPRAAAVAEILWSGAKDEQGRNRSQIEASPRLSEMRERLVALGVGAEPIQMPYCTMEGVVCQLGYMG